MKRARRKGLAHRRARLIAEAAHLAVRRGGYKVTRLRKIGSKTTGGRYSGMPDNKPESRPDNRETENEDLKSGSPPRPASEPAGSEGSSHTDKTLTDPATGVPN